MWLSEQIDNITIYTRIISLSLLQRQISLSDGWKLDSSIIRWLHCHGLSGSGLVWMAIGTVPKHVHGLPRVMHNERNVHMFVFIKKMVVIHHGRYSNPSWHSIIGNTHYHYFSTVFSCMFACHVTFEVQPLHLLQWVFSGATYLLQVSQNLKYRM